jgi:hypothetical protein
VAPERPARRRRPGVDLAPVARGTARPAPAAPRVGREGSSQPARPRVMSVILPDFRKRLLWGTGSPPMPFHGEVLRNWRTSPSLSPPRWGGSLTPPPSGGRLRGRLDSSPQRGEVGRGESRVWRQRPDLGSGSEAIPSAGVSTPKNLPQRGGSPEFHIQRSSPGNGLVQGRIAWQIRIF